ncbi:MAG: VCBS repeat-containing protein [Alphaproteobacteria bacterium]|nr:VCBS repeat-containing protein [Alphaproteobacteria bacterium]
MSVRRPVPTPLVGALLAVASPALAWDTLVVDDVSYGSCAVTGDMDGDGRPEVLACAGGDGILIFDNQGGVLVRAGRIRPPGEVLTADLGDADGDGDLDVLYGTRDTLGWAENLGGTYGPPTTLDTYAEATRQPRWGDFDGDGDLDIASALWSTNELFQYVNLDGLGTFSTARLIDNTFNNHVREVAVCDLDGDGYDNIILGEAFGRKVSVFDGSPFGMGPPYSRTSGGQTAAHLRTGDIDDDGDPDVVAGLANGAYLFATANGVLANGVRLITTPSEASVVMIDLDGDGIVEPLVVSQPEATIYSFPRVGTGPNSFGPAEVFYGPGEAVTGGVALDVEGDGDDDLFFWVHGQGLRLLRNDRIDGDADGDGLPASIDCDDQVAPDPDSDGDGVCDLRDVCRGDDALGDSDGDGLCDVSLTVAPVVPGGTLTMTLTGVPTGGEAWFFAGLHTAAAPICLPDIDVCREVEADTARRVLPDATGTATVSLPVGRRTPVGTPMYLQAGWIDDLAGEGEVSALITVTVQATP